jgi:hypothetical protein
MLADKISYLENKLQQRLFPLFEEHFEDELYDVHMRVVRTLEVVQIERLIPQSCPFQRGRPSKFRWKVARAFVAKHILNLRTTRELVYRLKIDRQLRYIRGWEPGEKVPDESLFSRIFSEMAEHKVPQKLHEKLAEKVFEGHVVLHCGRDSCPVPVRESSEKTGKKTSKRKDPPKYGSKRWGETRKGRQVLGGLSVEQMLDELPHACDHGRKISAKGTTLCWRGYKLHLDVAEGFFPLSAVLTSASTNDCEVAIPLSTMSSQRAHVLYELMDKAYDGEAIKNFISSQGRVPLIKAAIRGEKQKALRYQESRAQKTIGWKPAEAIRLKHRAVNERMFARLTDCFSTMSLWVKGHTKVSCHVLLSVVCLAVDELLRLSG